MAGYDEMMGLELGDFGAFLDTQMVKDALVAAAAGGAGILAGSWALDKLLSQSWMPAMITNNKTVAKGVGQIVLGIVAGRMLYDRNREAAMGVLGGLGALGAANIINTLLLKDKSVALSGDDDMAALSAGGMYDNMAALAALEATGVSASPDAFQGLGDPTVTQETLMGFGGPVVQQETLGYAPYLA